MHLRTCLSLLIVVMFCGTGFAGIRYQEEEEEEDVTATPGWDYEENYVVPSSGYKKNSGYGNQRYNDDNDDGYGKNSYKNDDDYGYGKNSYRDDDDDGYDYGSSKYAPSRQKREPDEYGNMNIYFREPSYSGKSKKPKRIIFPVHRFKKGHFPRLPPLISFLPWLPIFADKLTKQTIIFSPTGGLYIIPPVINMYGQMFSIAQLIASGYCSLVSSGVPPPPAVNVAPLVSPGAVTGPGIPPPNKATGGFNGGVQTQFSSFPKTNSGPKAGY